jgi:hypothetical protein
MTDMVEHARNDLHGSGSSWKEKKYQNPNTASSSSYQPLPKPRGGEGKLEGSANDDRDQNGKNKLQDDVPGIILRSTPPTTFIGSHVYKVLEFHRAVSQTGPEPTPVQTPVQTPASVVQRLLASMRGSHSRAPPA